MSTVRMPRPQIVAAQAHLGSTYARRRAEGMEQLLQQMRDRRVPPTTIAAGVVSLHGRLDLLARTARSYTAAASHMDAAIRADQTGARS